LAQHNGPTTDLLEVAALLEAELGQALAELSAEALSCKS
jgi:hypothetical protein